MQGCSDLETARAPVEIGQYGGHLLHFRCGGASLLAKRTEVVLKSKTGNFSGKIAPHWVGFLSEPAVYACSRGGSGQSGGNGTGN